MKRFLATTALAAGLTGGGAAAAPPEIEYIPVEESTVKAVRNSGSRLPFSGAVRVGDMVYLSGRIGNAADGSLPQGIAAQARQVMENVRAGLTSAGGSLDNVVRCTVMLDNMADWPAFNAVYVDYFPPERLPARSAFGADGLALGALVEVECTAYAPRR